MQWHCAQVREKGRAVTNYTALVPYQSATDAAVWGQLITVEIIRLCKRLMRDKRKTSKRGMNEDKACQGKDLRIRRVIRSRTSFRCVRLSLYLCCCLNDSTEIVCHCCQFVSAIMSGVGGQVKARVAAWIASW